MSMSSFIIVGCVTDFREGRLLPPTIREQSQIEPSGIGLKRIRFLSKIKKLTNLLNTLSFWLAYQQIFAIWLSNLSLLSIVTPKSLSSLFSQVLSSPVFAQHIQVFHCRRKASCHEQNYKCLCLVKKKRSFW